MPLPTVSIYGSFSSLPVGASRTLFGSLLAPLGSLLAAPQGPLARPLACWRAYQIMLGVLENIVDVRAPGGDP